MACEISRAACKGVLPYTFNEKGAIPTDNIVSLAQCAPYAVSNPMALLHCAGPSHRIASSYTTDEGTAPISKPTVVCKRVVIV